MRIDELTRPKDRTEAGNILSNAGYKKLGSGSYATIWHKEGSDQVLKLFDGSDHAYYDYIDLCNKHSNPHFPKFFSKPIKINGVYRAVKTELLSKPNISYTETECLDDYTRLRAQYRNDEGIKKALGGRYKEAFGSALKYLEDETFKKALDLITDELIIKKGYFSDIHPSNFMERNGVLVFSDPVT